MKERPIKEIDEILVRNIELDEPLFLTKDEALKREKMGEIIIVKEEYEGKTFSN